VWRHAAVDDGGECVLNLAGLGHGEQAAAGGSSTRYEDESARRSLKRVDYRRMIDRCRGTSFGRI
jgi:hypothetical protein